MENNLDLCENMMTANDAKHIQNTEEAARVPELEDALSDAEYVAECEQKEHIETKEKLAEATERLAKAEERNR